MKRFFLFFFFLPLFYLDAAFSSIHMTLQGGLPVVESAIRGNKCSLILDLGSSNTYLDADLIQRCRLKQEASTMQFQDILGNTHQSKVYKLDQLQIDQCLFSNLQIFENKAQGLLQGGNHSLKGVKGLVGRDLFKNRTLIIDPRRGTAYVTDQPFFNPATYIKGPWMTHPFELDERRGVILHLPHSRGKTLTFMLDTGSNVSLIHNRFLKSRQFSKKKPEKRELKLSNTNILGEFDFYPYNLKHVGVDGLLGFDFFQHFVVCLDFGSRKAYFLHY